MSYDQHYISYSILNSIKQLLKQTQNFGLPAEYYFYISLQTNHPEVLLPQRIKLRYPQEITIVFQYQFDDLVVEQDSFSVRLAFDGIFENITVPFHCITGFSDPNVTLSLKPILQEKLPQDFAEGKKAREQKQASSRLGEVISLEQFRNKSN